MPFTNNMDRRSGPTFRWAWSSIHIVWYPAFKINTFFEIVRKYFILFQELLEVTVYLSFIVWFFWGCYFYCVPIIMEKYIRLQLVNWSELVFKSLKSKVSNPKMIRFIITVAPCTLPVTPPNPTTSQHEVH